MARLKALARSPVWRGRRPRFLQGVRDRPRDVLPRSVIEPRIHGDVHRIVLDALGVLALLLVLRIDAQSGDERQIRRARIDATARQGLPEPLNVCIQR